MNQDIELRIRFAEYFAYVSVGDLRQGWRDYRDELEKHRQKIREDIDKMEVLWQKAGSKSTEKDTLERHLNWAYKEVGYVERNRSASSNPRAVDEPRDLGVSLGSIQPSRREIAQKVLDTFAAAGFGQFQQVAALANAIAESGLAIQVLTHRRQKMPSVCFCSIETSGWEKDIQLRNSKTQAQISR